MGAFLPGALPATKWSIRSVKLTVSHVIPYLGLGQGGPVNSLSGYVRGLRASDCKVGVLAAPRAEDGQDAQLPEGIDILRCRPAFCGNFRFCPALRRAVRSSGADIIHSHGLWTYASCAAGQAAQAMRAPHVLSPCGMLQSGAIRRSRMKKWICRRLFQDRVLKNANCLHAKSSAEVKGIRAFGLTNPVAVIPNPVCGPEATDRSWGGPCKTELEGKSGKSVLYLGRIHPVKGLSRLLEAWSRLWKTHRDWRLILAGPDEGGYQAKLEQQIWSAGIGGTVTFTGPVQGDAKWKLLQSCDVFVMPSDFENFGTAVAEAMLCGKPVITTNGTPWRQLPEEHAGWCVNPSIGSIEQAMREAMTLDHATRMEMGQRGKEIASPFTPEKVGRQLLELYTWLMNGATSPSFVQFAE